jgi:hypothetical protein
MHSDYLVAFVNAIHAARGQACGRPADDVTQRLYERLGNRLIQFLQVDPGRRLVTKSPSVLHIDRFFTFFPHARLVILVRDGRDVVSSCMQTFGWDFDRATRLWAAGAEEIHSFDAHASVALRHCYRIVRYEDLLTDPPRTLEDLLVFLHLDTTAFDFEAAGRLPVRGSSTYRGGSDRVHWAPVEKTEAFNPLQRWRSWGQDEHQRFAWLAGRQLGYFGYPPSAHAVKGGIPTAVHTLRDWKWYGVATGQRISNGVRRRLAQARRRFDEVRRSP